MLLRLRPRRAEAPRPGRRLQQDERGVSIEYVASTVEALHAACPHDWVRAFERAPSRREVKMVHLEGESVDWRLLRGLGLDVDCARSAAGTSAHEGSPSSAERRDGRPAAACAEGNVGRFLVLCGGRLGSEQLERSEPWSPSKRPVPLRACQPAVHSQTSHTGDADGQTLGQLHTQPYPPCEARHASRPASRIGSRGGDGGSREDTQGEYTLARSPL